MRECGEVVRVRCVASENVTSSHSTRRPVTSVWVSLIRECPRRVNCATTNKQVCKRRNELRDYNKEARELRDYKRKRRVNCATTNAFFVNEMLSFRLNVRGAMNCATTNKKCGKRRNELRDYKQESARLQTRFLLMIDDHLEMVLLCILLDYINCQFHVLWRSI